MQNSPRVQEGIAELKTMVSHLEALGVSRANYKIDLSVARGLGYYTGPVFETVLTKLPSIGSVFSGGRYDDLVARFSQNSFPATGASVGVDRLFAAMGELGLVKKISTLTKVIILNFDPQCEIYIETIASRLRSRFIPTEIYFGNEKNIKGQLAFALKQGIPYVLIVGSNEMKDDVVNIKTLASREQERIRLEDVVDFFEDKGI